MSRPAHLSPLVEAAPPPLRAYVESLERQADEAKGETPRIYELNEHDDEHVGGFARDSDTSRKAALANYPRSGSQRHRALLFIVQRGERGATSDEIVEAFGMLLQSVKPRLHELWQGDWLWRDGTTRRSRAGADVDVYWATEKGVAAVRENDGVQAPRPAEPNDLALF